MNYYEQFNIFTGVCKRRVSVNIFPELEQTNVFVYDSKGNMLYNVFIVGRDIRNKQKLPAYLNKIVTNVINLFMWREARQDDKHWKTVSVVMYVNANFLQRVGHTDII